MNQKFYAFLLSALLASTFVHDIRAKSVSLPSNNALITRSKREVSASINLEFKTVGNFSVFCNSEADIALGIDVEANSFILLNASGAGVIVYLDSNVAVSLQGLNLELNGLNVTEILEKLSGTLKSILEEAGDAVFEIVDATEEVLELVTSIVKDLVVGVEVDVKVALDLIIGVVQNLVAILSGVLQGLPIVIGDEVIQTKFDILAISEVLGAVESILGELDINLEAVLEARVELNLEDILGADNGIAALIAIIQQLGAKIKLDALASLLGNVESLLKIVVSLGGNVISGVTGVLSIVLELVLHLNGNGEGNIFTLINTLIAFVVYVVDSGVGDLTGAVNDLLQELLHALEELKLTAVLEGLVDIINNLLAGTLSVVGVSISAILKLLLNVVAVAGGLVLGVVCAVLVLLVGVAKAAEVLVQLLLVLICKLTTSDGISQLAALGIEIVDKSLVKIIASIGKAVTSLALGKVYKALSELPIIGDIIVALNAAVKTATDGKVSLEKILDATSLVELIKGVINKVLNKVVFEVSAEVKAQVEIILKASVNVNVSVAVTA